MKTDKSRVTAAAARLTEDMYDRFSSAERIGFEKFDPRKTVLVVVDVINGFIRNGVMADSRIESIVQPVKGLMEKCAAENIPIIAFADCHSENAAEFSAFPPHCIKGSAECELVSELRELKGYTLIEKNSVNGFHEPQLMRFIEENTERTDYIVCGDCTDICVMNFCLSLKTYFDRNDKNCRILIPVDATETYDGKGHDGDFMKLISLKIMENAGIEIVGGIDVD